MFSRGAVGLEDELRVFSRKTLGDVYTNLVMACFLKNRSGGGIFAAARR